MHWPAPQVVRLLGPTFADGLAFVLPFTFALQLSFIFVFAFKFSFAFSFFLLVLQVQGHLT